MSPLNQRTLGNVLVWLGVFAWTPFFVLVANDQPVSIFPFLAAHLTGVFGGAWLRSSADRLEGVNKVEHGQWRRVVSRIMIYLGVLAWVPYFYLDKVLGQNVHIGPFLAMHLTGVLGGAALRASVELDRFMPRK